MSFESMEAVIHFAIEKEIEAAAFYEDASRQEDYADVSDMFKGFVQEEKKHRTMLEGLLKGETKISDYHFTWIPDIKRSNYLVDLDYKKGMPYGDILRLAMKREEKALALYNDLLKKAEIDSMKTIFKILCQEEAGHKLALETRYDDYMAKMGD